MKNNTVKIYGLSPKKAYTLMRDKKVSVGVVGCGYIGGCIAAILAASGIRTVGIDVNKKLIEEMQRGKTSVHEPGLNELLGKSVRSGKFKATLDFGALRDADIIIVTVGTPLSKDYTPDMSHIIAASRSISENLKKGHLVILKSTLPPGTTEGIVKKILERSGLRAGKDFGLVFSPERLSEGSAIKELLSLPIVVGGFDEKSAELASKFWESALKVKTVRVADMKAAEMVKLADNVWIDLNIALANEIGLICDELDIDALEVIRAANTLPKLEHNVNILLPSMGVGGYCLTKDPWFFHGIGKKHGVNLKIPAVSRKINDAMPAYTFKLIKETLAEQGKKINRSKVAVLGIAFKSNTGDCRFTPTKHVISRLERSGCRLSVYDPLVHDRDAKTVTRVPMSQSLEDTVRGADCVAFFTGHEQFRKFPLGKLRRLVNKKCSLIDGRNMFSREEIKKIKRLGFAYRGIGRK